MTNPRLIFLLAVFCAASTLRAGVEEDWAAVIALDAGPKQKPTSIADARSLAAGQLALQRNALENFIRKYPQNAHSFDARKRLAAVWAAEGRFEDKPAATDKALALLTELENSPAATSSQKADVAFLHASIEMQNQKGNVEATREAVVKIAQDFCVRFPTDRRGPRLLVEAATLCDDVPAQKQALLEKALRETNETGLKQRIQDDFRRLSQLNKPLDLRFSSANGGDVDLASFKGNVVIVIFWAAESPHSLMWLEGFRAASEKLPKDKLKIVTVSLDNERPAMATKLRELPSTWPAYFDGKGWEGPVPRTLGINALPSVWILDKKGIVRTINGKSTYEAWINQLLKE